MKTILLVDDEEPVVKMYSAVLSDSYELLTASSGREALDILRSKHPDLIFLDIIMPAMNGLDVLKQIKSAKETQDIPVVMLTNLPQEASGSKALALGASDYFVKVNNEPAKIAAYAKKILSI